MSETEGTWTIRNEFAFVTVSIDESGHDPRLLIRNAETGESTSLDALELEALTRFAHDELNQLLDPSNPAGEPVDGD